MSSPVLNDLLVPLGTAVRYDMKDDVTNYGRPPNGQVPQTRVAQLPPISINRGGPNLPHGYPRLVKPVVN